VTHYGLHLLKKLSRISFAAGGALTYLFGISAQADDFSGTIFRNNQSVFLDCNSGCSNKVELRAMTADSQKTLDRLQNSDFLEGTGGLINGAIVLDSVDFVGLANLVGIWKSGGYWVEFVNFNKANMYLDSELWDGKPTPMQYSIIPGDKGNWKVLFSNDKTVNPANLILNNNTLLLEIFDQNTGHSQVYSLFKYTSSTNATQVYH
jgi:hypothetical protein